jgi:hypothetical protein
MRYRGESYLLMISHREHPHPPRSKLTIVSFDINEFGEYGDELGLCLELGGELLEQDRDMVSRIGGG